MSDSPRAASTDQLPAGTRAPLSPIDLLAFACDLTACGSLSIWGFAMWPFPWNIVAGVGAPVLAIIVWALFVSPRAVLAVHPYVRAVAELLVYVSATIAWWSMGLTWVGLAFGVLAVTVGVFAGRRRFA